MSITTYSELKSAIASWLARSDLTDNITDFITLFECHAVRELHLRPTETTASLTPSSGSAALPSDFLDVITLTWTGSPKRELIYVHPTQLITDYPTEPSGQPAEYTIQAGSILIRPIDTTALTLLYRAKTSAISSSLQWLFNNHVDAYINGAMVEALLFLKDPEGAAVWEARRDKILNSIMGSDFRTRQPGIAIRVGGPTP